MNVSNGKELASGELLGAEIPPLALKLGAKITQSVVNLKMSLKCTLKGKVFFCETC